MSGVGPTVPRVQPAEIRAMLQDGGELALVDVREEGVFSDAGHPFFANSMPLSRLELLFRERVPRPVMSSGGFMRGRCCTRGVYGNFRGPDRLCPRL